MAAPRVDAIRVDAISITQTDKRKIRVALPASAEEVARVLNEADSDGFRLTAGVTDEEGVLVLVLVREGRS